MSRDWNVHCLDCKATHGFDDANREVELMLLLCKHAASIAALSEAAVELAGAGQRGLHAESLRLVTPYGEIDPLWFRTHLGHTLVPIDEYGETLGGDR